MSENTELVVNNGFDDFSILKIKIYQNIAKSLGDQNKVIFSFIDFKFFTRLQIITSLDEVMIELNEIGINPIIHKSDRPGLDSIKQIWSFTDDDKGLIEELLYSYPEKFGLNLQLPEWDNDVTVEETFDDFEIFKMGIYRHIATNIKSKLIVDFTFSSNSLLSKSQIETALQETARELHQLGIIPTITLGGVGGADIIFESWGFTQKHKILIENLWYSNPEKFGMMSPK